LVFVSAVSAWAWYAFQNDVLDEHIYTIAALLLTTFIINTMSDLIKSEMENILEAIEYDKSKIKYKSLDTKF